MSIARQITSVRKRHSYFEPHERIESIGGNYLGYPWVIPEFMAIYYVKKKLERYYVIDQGIRKKIIIGTYQGKEYLKADSDDYSPDSLLNLPGISAAIK